MKAKSRYELDRLDWRIIEQLQVNSRKPLAKLGREIGLSQPAISERVKRLEKAGVIEGYSARVNAHAVGLDLVAIARLKTSFQHLKACYQLFASMPEVLEVHRVTGEDCFILKVIVPRAAQLESVVDRMAKYGSVTTSIVLTSTTPAPITRKAAESE
jgi:Lrp/AsnC family transcriptional regulator, leucine-responsive regulatory protein